MFSSTSWNLHHTSSIISSAAMTGQVRNQPLKVTKPCLHHCDWCIPSRQMREQWVNSEASGGSSVLTCFSCGHSRLPALVQFSLLMPRNSRIFTWGFSPCCPTEEPGLSRAQCIWRWLCSWVVILKIFQEFWVELIPLTDMVGRARASAGIYFQSGTNHTVQPQVKQSERQLGAVTHWGTETRKLFQVKRLRAEVLMAHYQQEKEKNDSSWNLKDGKSTQQELNSDPHILTRKWKNKV